MIPQPEGELHPTSTMTLGIIASGSGRRWGGRDKATLCYEGETLLGQLVRIWGPFCREIIVNSHHANSLHAHLTDRSVCDTRPDRGPCLGIAALLAACETPLLLLAPVDLLEPPVTLPQKLLDALQPSNPGCYAIDRGQHSLVMLLRRNSASMVQTYLQQGGQRVGELIEHIGLTAVNASMPLRDADTPADL